MIVFILLVIFLFVDSSTEMKKQIKLLTNLQLARFPFIFDWFEETKSEIVPILINNVMDISNEYNYFLKCPLCY